MSDSEATVDLEALRKSRASYLSVATRSRRKFQKMLTEEVPATLDLEGLADHLTSLETAERRGLRTHDSICDEEQDPGQLDKDEEARDSFVEDVLAAKSLLKRLIALRKACGLVEELRYKLESVESTKSEEPTKDHSSSIERVTTLFTDYQGILRGSTIEPGHVLWQTAKEMNHRIDALCMKDAPAPIISTARPGKASNTSLPKAALPKFNGDIMEWTAFWKRFREVVHDNPDVSTSMKLGYLRDAITDPNIKRLLHSCDETEGYYGEMVALLQSRFDQTQIIHASHCRALADLRPAHSNKDDILHLADVIY